MGVAAKDVVARASRSEVTTKSTNLFFKINP